MAKKRKTKVKDLELWMQKVDSENVPVEEWNPYPKLIHYNYTEKKIDKDMALYLLKQILYNREDTWNNLGHRKNCLKYIVEISDKDKKLRAFLEEVFITEHWFPIRLRALEYLTEYFPKLAFTLFNHISEEMGYVRLLEWTLNKTDFKAKDIKFLTQIVDDPIVKLQILLREKIYFPKVNLAKRKIYFRETEILLGEHEKFKRFSLIKESTDEIILTQSVKYFIWKNRNENGVIYEFDKEKAHPILILHKEEKDGLMIYYGTSKEQIESIINSIKETFGLENINNFKIIKTTVVYLILDNRDSNFSLKSRLGEYRVKIKGELI
jgi:hypothetical protein